MVKRLFCLKKGYFLPFITYIVSTRNIHSYARNSYSYVRNKQCYGEKHDVLSDFTCFFVVLFLFRKKINTLFCQSL